MKVEQWKIKNIIPYENNPRINDQAVDKTAMSIKEYGWQQPIVVDKKGIVIAGHTRLKAAKKLGLKTCPVVVAKNLTPAQVKGYRIADNKTGELAEFDEDLLNIEIKELMDMDFDIELTGFELDDFDFPGEGEERLTDDDDISVCDEQLCLVRKNAVNKVRTCYFFSLYRWNSKLKKQQIKVFQQNKEKLNIDFVKKIAEDYTEFLKSIFHLFDKKWVLTPAPIGNSKKKAFNLCQEISKKIAENLGINYMELFLPFKRKDKNVCNYKNKQGTGLSVDLSEITNIILIDDIATTGTTMETCLSLLQNKHVIPVVYIYSEAME